MRSNGSDAFLGRIFRVNPLFVAVAIVIAFLLLLFVCGSQWGLHLMVGVTVDDFGELVFDGAIPTVTVFGGMCQYFWTFVELALDAPHRYDGPRWCALIIGGLSLVAWPLALLLNGLALSTDALVCMTAVLVVTTAALFVRGLFLGQHTKKSSGKTRRMGPWEVLPIKGDMDETPPDYDPVLMAMLAEGSALPSPFALAASVVCAHAMGMSYELGLWGPPTGDESGHDGCDGRSRLGLAWTERLDAEIGRTHTAASDFLAALSLKRTSIAGSELIGCAFSELGDKFVLVHEQFCRRVARLFFESYATEASANKREAYLSVCLARTLRVGFGYVHNGMSVRVVYAARVMVLLAFSMVSAWLGFGFAIGELSAVAWGSIVVIWACGCVLHVLSLPDVRALADPRGCLLSGRARKPYARARRMLAFLDSRGEGDGWRPRARRTWHDLLVFAAALGRGAEALDMYRGLAPQQYGSDSFARRFSEWFERPDAGETAEGSPRKPEEAIESCAFDKLCYWIDQALFTDYIDSLDFRREGAAKH